MRSERLSDQAIVAVRIACAAEHLFVVIQRCLFINLIKLLLSSTRRGIGGKEANSTVCAWKNT